MRLLTASPRSFSVREYVFPSPEALRRRLKQGIRGRQPEGRLCIGWTFKVLSSHVSEFTLSSRATQHVRSKEPLRRS